MKKYQSQLYGLIPQPESFAELLEILIRKEKPSYDNQKSLFVRYWRGQSNVNWRLDSSAYRRIIQEEIFAKSLDESLRSYEERLLNYATHQGYRYYKGRKLSDMELLARLQHHGAATRLIDFSANALIALWFCANSHERTDGLLIGIHSDHLGGSEKSLEERPYSEVMDICEKYKHAFLWDSPVSTDRISAQHSAFLYSKYSDHPAGSLSVDYNEPGHLFICISPKLKRSSKEILEKVFNVRTHTLFPDIDGFGMANNQNIDQWSNVRW